MIQNFLQGRFYRSYDCSFMKMTSGVLPHECWEGKNGVYSFTAAEILGMNLTRYCTGNCHHRPVRFLEAIQVYHQQLPALHQLWQQVVGAVRLEKTVSCHCLIARDMTNYRSTMLEKSTEHGVKDCSGCRFAQSSSVLSWWFEFGVGLICGVVNSYEVVVLDLL